MTPHHRWRRTNRPQTPRNSLPRRGFPPISREYRVKKIVRRFERWARVLRLINVGAVIPPHRLYSARAPIHPKRPYGLTRPVVPPDGSFISGRCFRRSRAACNVGQTTGHTHFICLRDAQFSRVPSRAKSPARASQRGHAAARLDGGWSRQPRICAGIFDRCALP
jgi:hypothetical protein